MPDDSISDNQRKAELSFAYLSALCAMLGYTCQRGPTPDEDSIDATVRARGVQETVVRCSIESDIIAELVCRRSALRVEPEKL